MALVLVSITFIIYRMFFQFDNSEVKIYVREEAAKYNSSVDVYNTIMRGVEYVLASHNLTQNVLTVARATNTDREQELVNAAVNACRSFGWLPVPQ